jgi:hypothetical protein
MPRKRVESCYFCGWNQADELVGHPLNVGQPNGEQGARWVKRCEDRWRCDRRAEARQRKRQGTQ